MTAVFLFLYAFRNVNEGIDVTDSGYHFSNFLYMNKMDPMWIFSTYLASLLGHFFTMLPGGNTLLGLNIYTAVIPAVLGVAAFVFFVKVLNSGILESFLGVFVALSLCWCPTTCVYNYLTYLFFGAGAMLLYMGLTKEKNIYLTWAGVFLGINVLVRFPNAAEAALIVVVWYVCFLRRVTLGEYVGKTWHCLKGYLLGIGVVFVQIQLQYGIDEYIKGIFRLFEMTDNASDYTPYAMVYNIVKAYLFSGKWFVIIAFCVLLGVLGYMVLPGRFMKLKAAGYGICCLVLVRWFYGQGMFSFVFKAEGYGAILNWGVVFVITALVSALYLIVNPKTADAEKTLAAIVIVVIAITPLGSNNQLYSNLNNLFLVIPFVLRFFFCCYQKGTLKTVSIKGIRLHLYQWPLCIMSLVCVGMLLFQSATFGNTFTFRDDSPRDSRVTTIPALKYMKTNGANAASLEQLGAYVQEAGLTGHSVLLFGDIPALSAYLRMPFVLSPWPGLPSYTCETFKAELLQVQENIKENRPVIIFSSKFYNFLTSMEENVRETEYYNTNYGFKLTLLRDMIREYDYVCTFENEGYVIFE